jgi:hypothetical protein
VDHISVALVSFKALKYLISRSRDIKFMFAFPKVKSHPWVTKRWLPWYLSSISKI